MSGRFRGLLTRMVKFYTVGAIGIFVQLAALAVLKSGLKLNYLVATGLAVEIAVLHCFFWHVHFTWRDRPGGRRETFLRLVRFNLTNGLISILGNLAVMKLLAGKLHLHYLASNLIAIAACSVLNYLASDLFVFVPPPPAPAPADGRE